MPLVGVNWLIQKHIPPGVIGVWPSTVASIPAGWTRVTSLDARFVRQIPNASTNPGGTGGGLTDHTYVAHPHTYSHSQHTFGSGVGNEGDGGTSVQAGAPTAFSASAFHSHSAIPDSPSISASNNSSPSTWSAHIDPAHLTVIFIQSDGTPTGWAVNMVLWNNGAAPTGWSAYGSLDNRLHRGAAGAADGGTQAGNDSHTHTAAHSHAVGGTHTHVVTLGTPDATATHFVGSGGNDSSNDTHTHAVGTSTSGSNPTNSDSSTESSGTGDQAPAWQKMRAIQKTGSISTTAGVIAMWLGTIATVPTSFKLCDGTSGTPNLSQGNFVRAAATDGEVGNTGGAATHSHSTGAGHTHTSAATTHSHTMSATSGGNSAQHATAVVAGAVVAYFLHNHSVSVTATTTDLGTSSSAGTTVAANTVNAPTYTEIAYIQAL